MCLPLADLGRAVAGAGAPAWPRWLYDGLNAGRIEIALLRRSLAALPLPAWPDGRIRLAVDVSTWLRPDAETSPERVVLPHLRPGKGNAQMIPGWPYSVIAGLESSRTSWTAVLDAVRLGPDDDLTEVTAAQVRDVVARLAEAGHWREGDPAILVGENTVAALMREQGLAARAKKTVGETDPREIRSGETPTSYLGAPCADV